MNGQQKAERRVVAVTGAAQGLGAEIAERLADEGFSLVVLDLSGDGLNKTMVSIKAQNPHAEVLGITADLSSEEAVADAFAQIDERFGRLDALVNTAGGSGNDSVRDLGELHLHVWKKVIDNNLTSTFLCCKVAVPLMERNGYGRIVNFSSAVANGISGPSGTVGARLPYAASKAAINGFTKQFAKDLGPSGITVNAIAPGLILPAAGRIRDNFEALPDAAQAATRAAIPVGRPGTGTEIAAAVSYLVSAEAGFTSGAVFNIDGAAF